MTVRRYIPAAALVLAGFCATAAFAQTPPVGMQAAVIPGAVPISVPGAPAAPTNGKQVVPMLGTASTASTPGVLDQFGLPSIEHAGVGDVAGLLSYCVSKQAYDGTSIRVAGRQLAARADVQSDPYYALGGQGLLQTASSTPFDVSTLDINHRSEICAQLTQRGRVVFGAS